MQPQCYRKSPVFENENALLHIGVLLFCSSLFWASCLVSTARPHRRWPDEKRSVSCNICPLYRRLRPTTQHSHHASVLFIREPSTPIMHQSCSSLTHSHPENRSNLDQPELSEAEPGTSVPNVSSSWPRTAVVMATTGPEGLDVTLCLHVLNRTWWF